MKHFVAKTILKTLLIAILALGVAFGVASLGFPAQMAGMFENMGAYSFATGYASLAYTYSGKTEDLARCVDDSIFAHDDKNIVSFGDKLLADGGFGDYCSGRTGYKQFVTGSIACAKYRRGDKEGALNTAGNALGSEGFPRPNALGALCLAAYDAQDREFMDELYAEVSARTPSDEGESGYLSDILQLLNEKNQ